MRKESISVYSDVTGNLIEDNAIQATVTVRSRSVVLDIDGSILDEELSSITLAEALERGQRVKNTKTSGTRRARNSEQSEARKFAQANGIKVGDRGAVRKEIMDLYAAVKSGADLEAEKAKLPADLIEAEPEDVEVEEETPDSADGLFGLEATLADEGSVDG